MIALLNHLHYAVEFLLFFTTLLLLDWNIHVLFFLHVAIAVLFLFVRVTILDINMMFLRRVLWLHF